MSADAVDVAVADFRAECFHEEDCRGSRRFVAAFLSVSPEEITDDVYERFVRAAEEVERHLERLYAVPAPG